MKFFFILIMFLQFLFSFAKLIYFFLFSVNLVMIYLKLKYYMVTNIFLYIFLYRSIRIVLNFINQKENLQNSV
jgi:hypothetical protein